MEQKWKKEETSQHTKAATGDNDKKKSPWSAWFDLG
jgi:hypothetical protein